MATKKQVVNNLKAIRLALNLSSVSRRRGQYEQLRVKIANDILDVMKERGLSVESLSQLLKTTNEETRNIIWNKDLTLYELTRLLDLLGCSSYFVIRSR